MFVDSNIFILAALGMDLKARRCRGFLARVERGEQRAITSVLALDETLKIISGHVRRERAAAITARLSSIPNLKICDVTPAHFSDSLEYFRAGLEPRDALHVAVMLDNAVEKILSYDRDFDSIPGIKRLEPQ